MQYDTPSGNLEERLREALRGRYDIERELPGGGMSRVFVAREVALDRRVVVKVLPPDVAAEVNRDRFRAEVQFAARLQHPHIVPLLSAGEEAGLLYYTMPFIEGESLKADISRGRRFTEEEALEILVDVVDALQYAHEAGIVHRDIKPANILRSGKHAVVTDFGVAKALTAALRTRIASAGITTSGVAIGTPQYMAPEQIAGDPAADHRVDIYAVGLLAYELLSGKTPFSGPSPQAMMAAHLTGDAEPLNKVRSDLSPMLVAIVKRCLEKEASRRPASAAALLEVLRTISATTGTSQVRAMTAQRTWGTAAAAVVVIAMAAVAWISVRNAREQTQQADRRVSAAGDTVRRADSLLQAQRRQAVNDSLGRLAAQREEQKRLSKVTDSLIAIQRRSLDSTMNELKKSGPPQQTMPPVSSSSSGTTVQSMIPGFNLSVVTPEMIQARALNMGPPRRTFVELSQSSMVNTPDVILKAGVVRDSIIKRLNASTRYRPIPLDSAQAALARSRTFDTLGKWLNVELFVTIRTSPLRSDSIAWLVEIRDLGAHSSYNSRAAQSRSSGVADGMQFDVPKLLDQVVRALGEVDRGPRKPPVPTSR